MIPNVHNLSKISNNKIWKQKSHEVILLLKLLITTFYQKLDLNRIFNCFSIFNIIFLNKYYNIYIIYIYNIITKLLIILFIINFVFILFFQQNLFPEAGTIYDYVFIKNGNGSWSRWLDTLDKNSFNIPAEAKVWP